ncbi:MAG: BCCT family transporter, partial [Lachnospiraceae bacterium]|nr:BCCT family transporter [Lachnospiraceae bacterium]
IYYWAYWMVWCVAAPFFIGSISRGRTIRQVIGGGYLFGVGSTLVSFLVLGGYGQALEYKKIADFLTPFQNGADLYRVILKMMGTLPFSSLFLLITLLCMICFYATSFDSIAYTAACYSYRRLEEGAKPRKRVIFLWCLLLIVLPIALVFSDSSMQQIQSVSIIFAFPIGIILLLVIYSFLKDARLVISSHI